MNNPDLNRILILDDDIQLGELLKTYLETSGAFLVEQITLGCDLLPRLAAAQPYQLMLLDFHLPDTTGLDVLGLLTDSEFRLPVIMMTGKGDQRIAAQAIQRGASDYLIKGDNFWPDLPNLIQKTIRLHQAQEEARRSMEQVRYQALLLDNMRDAVVVWDLSGKITFWNPAAYLLYRLKPQEMLGHPAREAYLSLFSLPIALPGLGDTATAETEREMRPGISRVQWISSRLMPLRSPDQPNILIGYMDVTRDITHRKQEQQALKQSQKFVQNIIDTTPNVIYIYDLVESTITFVNQMAHEMLSYTPDTLAELTTAALLQLVHPDDRALLKERRAVLVNAEDGKVVEAEFRVRHHNGNWLWLYCRESIFARDPNGQPRQVIGAAQDITERKIKDARIQQAQSRLVQAARLSAIGQLATGVAHQISNPLTAILGEAQLLQQSLPVGDPMRESLEVIETAGWRAQWAVQVLNKFAEPPSSAIGSVDLYDAIQLAVNLVGVNLQSEGATIQLNLTGTSPQVHGNQRQIETLWVNLLLFIRSMISIPACAIEIQPVDLADDQAVIEIRLGGIQVTPEHLNAIFDPELSFRPGEDISGMEYSICLEIARQNQGSIQVTSAPQSSIFRVTLPKEM